MRSAAASCRRSRCRAACGPAATSVFHAPLRIGDALARVSRIESITGKQGRSGTLVFVRVEGYPGLIVHGPLIATLLLDLVRRERRRARVTRFAFRARSPLFDLHPFDVCGEPAEGGTVRLWARGHAGHLAMDATATIE
jgi:hydroxyacyl-ACP dehydratase HTD2-like protein with hotdog domain